MKITALIFIFLQGFMGKQAFAAESCRVLVVVGMEDERAIAAGDDVDVVVGTANAAVLRQRLEKIDTANINAVYSFGVAGSLDPTLKPGDLLVSTRVVAQSTDTGPYGSAESWMADQGLLMAILAQTAAAERVKVRKAVFLGTDFEARDNPEANNQNLHKLSGADIIDNESHIAAIFAAEHNLPFMSVRAVSDSVNNGLPPAALIALDEDGSPNGFAIAKSLLKNPWQIPALIRTAREYQKALNSLKVFRRDIGFLQPANCSGG